MIRRVFYSGNGPLKIEAGNFLRQAYLSKPPTLFDKIVGGF